MQYIHLSNDSYILKTSKGIHNFTRKSFNFNKIKKLINKGAPEEKVIPYLETPKLTNGIFELYINTGIDKMFYCHIEEHNGRVYSEYYWLGGEDEDYVDESKEEFVGVYASKEDIIEDWPEYII
jgi:hypothetical protein